MHPPSLLHYGGTSTEDEEHYEDGSHLTGRREWCLRMARRRRMLMKEAVACRASSLLAAATLNHGPWGSTARTPSASRYRAWPGASMTHYCTVIWVTLCLGLCLCSDEFSTIPSASSKHTFNDWWCIARERGRK